MLRTRRQRMLSGGSFLVGLVAVALLFSLSATARYFKDERQHKYRVSVRVSPSGHRIKLIQLRYEELRTEDGDCCLAGYAELKNLPVHNGRFRGVQLGSAGEGITWRFVARGRIIDDRTVRGTTSIHVISEAVEGSEEPGRKSDYWSGAGSGRQSFVSFLATIP
jgi:hypothetical protein